MCIKNKKNIQTLNNSEKKIFFEIPLRDHGAKMLRTIANKLIPHTKKKFETKKCINFDENV